MKAFKSIAAPTTLAVLLLAALTPAGAAPVTQTFTLTASAATVSGDRIASFIGTVATGQFTYETDTVTGFGEEWLWPGYGLTEVLLTVFGQTFSAADDAGFPDFPTLAFLDGVPTGLDLALIAEPGELAFSSPLVLRVNTSSLSAASGGGSDFVGPLEIVSLPATPLLLGLGLLGLAAAGRLGPGWPRTLALAPGR